MSDYRRVRKPRRKKKRMQLMGRKLSDFICLDGFTHIIGVDEAGWGALAGPISVGSAMVTVKEAESLDTKDSKRYTTEKSREAALDAATEILTQYSWRFAHPGEIDDKGYISCLYSLQDHVIRDMYDWGKIVLANQEFRPLVVVDGNKLYKDLIEGVTYLAIPKADDFVPVVSAASCVAKVMRDEYMHDLHESHPDWLLYKHKGYGTREHINLLKSLGPFDGVHRPKPVYNTLNKG